MDNYTAVNDKVFIEQQRARLKNLHTELLSDIRAEEAEELDVNAESSGEARESDDDAQKLTLLEIDGALAARDMRRLQPIERALKKIEDGTYGFSDISGKPISIERLEAIPEAILTATEENLNHSSL